MADHYVAIATLEGCEIRGKPITDSGRSRSPIPEQADH
jgi:hypothetical protein